MTAGLATIFRLPLESAGGEALQSASLTEGRALPLDGEGSVAHACPEHAGAPCPTAFVPAREGLQGHPDPGVFCTVIDGGETASGDRIEVL